MGMLPSDLILQMPSRQSRAAMPQASKLHMNGRLEQPAGAWITRRKMILVCFGLALAVRLTALLVSGAYRAPQPMENMNAIRFARTGEIAYPFMVLDTGRTTVLNPLYIVIAGSCYRLGGEGQGGEFLKDSLGIVISSLRAALMVWMALELGLDASTAFAAGMASAISITSAGSELRFISEQPLACDMLILLSIWGLRLVRRTSIGNLQALAYGAAWGVALLTGAR